MANVRVIEASPQRGVSLRVAAYCRVSSGSEDQLHSCASQIKHYTELIQNTPGWQLVDIYADEGISGTGTDKREEFQRMLRDARQGKMDKILVKSSSRFARNTHDCLAALRELKGMGGICPFRERESGHGESGNRAHAGGVRLAGSGGERIHLQQPADEL